MLTAGSFSTMVSDVQEEVVPAHRRQNNSRGNGGHLSSLSLFWWFEDEVVRVRQ